MEIIVHSVHVKIDAAFEEYVRAKIQKLRKFMFDEGRAEFIVKREGPQYVTEISIHTKHSSVFLKEKSENLNKSVELLMDKTKKKLRRLHEKVIDKSLK